MKSIILSDMTLVLGKDTLSFKEKIEIVRHLDNLHVDVIDMPIIENKTTDILLIKTISAFVKNSIISVETGITVDGVKNAVLGLATAKKKRLKISIPVSTVQMEYVCHKKPAKLLEVAKCVIDEATSSVDDVELYLEDATRADMSFMKNLIDYALSKNVSTITFCDNEGVMLPDEFANFINTVKTEFVLNNNVNLGILCGNVNGLSTANALMAIKNGVNQVKTAISFNDFTKTDVLAGIINNVTNRINAKTNLNILEIKRITSQIEWVLSLSNGENSIKPTNTLENINTQETLLTKTDSKEFITETIKKLGYDLTEEDILKVYDEFLRVATRKQVGVKELDAIVASVALQVPPTYVLKNYVINNGNTISSTAQIKLVKNNEELLGICVGDGPVDASFKALEQIIGSHYELDDFQIQSVTEGREAIGLAIVKLRHEGKVYSGNGISTDIIGSSIRAYINAVNKIVYEEI